MTEPSVENWAPLRWGIVGCGYISYNFCLAILRLNKPNKHKLYGVASQSDFTKAQEFAAKFQISKTYHSYEDLFKDDEIDAVYIGNYNAGHFSAAKVALEYEKPILVEKPLTTTLEQTKILLEMAKLRKILLVEAMWTRFMPPFRSIREKLESGQIKPLSLNVNFCVNATHVDRVTKPELGGGVLLDMGIYGIQLATMLFGQIKPEQIAATGVSNEQGVDMANAISLKYPNGSCATILVDGRSGHRSLVEANVLFTDTSEFISLKICPPFYVPTKLQWRKKDGQLVEEEFSIYPELGPAPGGLEFRNPASQALAYEAEAFYDIFQKWKQQVKNSQGESFPVIEHPLRTHQETLIDAEIINSSLKQWQI